MRGFVNVTSSVSPIERRGAPVRAGAAVGCEVDGRWAAPQSGVALSTAINQALGEAARALAALDQRRQEQDTVLAEAFAHLRDGTLERADVGDVGFQEQGRVRTVGQPIGQGRAGRPVDVDEGHARALRGEALDQAGTDAGRAPGDEHDALAQAGIDGEGGRGRLGGSGDHGG